MATLTHPVRTPFSTRSVAHIKSLTAHGAFGALAFGVGASEVEHVLAWRWKPRTYVRNRRNLEFKVHWKGYHDGEDSWTSLEDMEGAEEAIEDFRKEYPDCPNPSDY